MSRDLTFADATARVVPYLRTLGVGALYASPLLESGAGSNHGYDVVDPARVSHERGGESGRLELVTAVRSAGLGLILDIVPNHLGVEVAAANPWWFDVLRHGRRSRYARYFDIDWDAGLLLIPILGCDSAEGEDTELGNLSLSEADDEQWLCYYDHAFPIADGTGAGTVREVHDRQHYRLVSWRRGAAELTYRRFFDVSTLAAVRVEDPAVFEATHREVPRWVAHGDIDGLRVDHPDGLSDPGQYLRRLRAQLGPHRWLVVEKILGIGEQLPVSWPVHGTTGYDALREICGVFIDPASAGTFSDFAAEHLGHDQTLHEAEFQARLEVAHTILAAEISRIAATVPPVSASSRTDPTPNNTGQQRVREAVAYLLCGFPVYRSYLPSLVTPWKWRSRSHGHIVPI